MPPAAFIASVPQSHEASASGARKGSVNSMPKSPPTFSYRHGRRYHGDESIPYFLPCDVQELSRQSLFHEVQREVYGGYHCAEFADDNIPSKVLEIGCGTAIWSASVADSFATRGRPDVQFVGLDIVPVHGAIQGKNFTFVQHNFQSLPLPFLDGEFDYVMCREISMATPVSKVYGLQITEFMRILKPGGTLEVQCCTRANRSHIPPHVHLLTFALISRLLHPLTTTNNIPLPPGIRRLPHDPIYPVLHVCREPLRRRLE